MKAFFFEKDINSTQSNMLRIIFAESAQEAFEYLEKVLGENTAKDPRWAEKISMYHLINDLPLDEIRQLVVDACYDGNDPFTNLDIILRSE